MMSPDLATLDVALGARSYPIRIGPGALREAGRTVAAAGAHGAVVVTNATVATHWLAPLRASLAQAGVPVEVVMVPDGETHKNWTTLHDVLTRLLELKAERRTMLVALGGGVVGDITGFAAAIYQRGMPFVQVPTTLLAQVDSSVGGKTGVNHPLGKNMIGVFNQPLRVVADLDALATLPERELNAGLAEVIKYGPIADDEFFGWIEQHADELVALQPAALMHAVKRSCEIKAAVVGQDERESGLRAILNFGHTFGHAIEAGLGYGEWLHGEAVGCGMVMAATLSMRLGLIDAAYVARLRRLVERVGLPVRAPDLGRERWLELMRVDKKTEGGAIRYVVIEAPGRAAMRAVPDEVVAGVVAECSG